MHTSFEDITSRIGEEPRWWDANGTPRYGPFTPKACPNIYAHTVVLYRIACQDCGEQFDVESHASLWDEIVPTKLHYGDPPSHDCVGDTMNCDDLEVVEVWHKDDFGEWQRRPEAEGSMA